jgi:hypothetical protein
LLAVAAILFPELASKKILIDKKRCAQWILFEEAGGGRARFYFPINHF